MVVNLTHRELILIRVALMRNLTSIQKVAPKSYEESRDLLNGKLWIGMNEAKREEDRVNGLERV